MICLNLHAVSHEQKLRTTDAVTKKEGKGGKFVNPNLNSLSYVEFNMTVLIPDTRNTSNCKV